MQQQVQSSGTLLLDGWQGASAGAQEQWKSIVDPACSDSCKIISENTQWVFPTVATDDEVSSSLPDPPSVVALSQPSDSMHNLARSDTDVVAVIKDGQSCQQEQLETIEARLGHIPDSREGLPATSLCLAAGSRAVSMRYVPTSEWEMGREATIGSSSALGA